MNKFNKYTHIKYKHGSDVSRKGLDCITFIFYFYKKELKIKYKIPIPSYDIDWYDNDSYLYFNNINNYCDIVKYDPRREPRLYDMLFFSKNKNSHKISHAGIYIGNNLMIHCIEDKGVCITKLSLCNRYLHYNGRIKGVFIDG